MQVEIYSPPANHQDQDRGWALLSVCMAFMACAVLSTILRVFVRARLTRNMGWDDYSMIAATVRQSCFSRRPAGEIPVVMG